MAEEQNTMPTQVSAFNEFMNSIGKNGIVKTFIGVIIFGFLSFMSYIALNPSIIFERYDKYVERKHSESTEYRMQSSPLVRTSLNQLSMEVDAERAYIIEYHNGKSNPSGLQWQYGDMTFINDNTEDIRDEYQNISLVKYSIFYELYERGIWIGTTEEMAQVDKRFALRADVNDVKYMGFVVLYGTNLSEVGVLGVSFLTADNVDETTLKKVLRKYATSISPLLDGAQASKITRRR